MDKEVYKIVDDFLNSLNNRRGSNALGKIFFDAKGIMAIEIMKKYQLILWTGPLKPVSLVTISLNGEKIISKYGGIENYINSLNEKAETKENLELEKLKGDVKKLQYDIKNSKYSALTFWIGFGIAVLSFLMSLYTLFHR